MKQNNDINGITPLQNYSSAKTSLPSNEPKGFKLIDWQKGTVNLDLGGGKTTFGTDYLEKQGVKNLIYDFNYSAEHNKEIAEYVKENKVDTVTCFNVLNVLDTDAAIDNMVLMAAKALKADGIAYFQVYNKGSKGASQNNQSFQQGEPLSFYVPFVEKYFGKVKKTSDLIIATKPIKTTKKSQWQFAFDSNEGLLFGVEAQRNNGNLSGGLYTNEIVDSIDKKIKGGIGEDMPISEIIAKYNCYITKYPTKKGIGYALVFLYYREHKGEKINVIPLNFEITQNIYRTLKNKYNIQTNPAAEVLWNYWTKEYIRYNSNANWLDDTKYNYLVYNIMGYWEDKLLNDDENHPHVLHQYTKNTTEKEYINDINAYDVLINHSDLQKLELQLLGQNFVELGSIYNRRPNKFLQLENKIFPKDDELQKIYQKICKCGNLSLNLLNELKTYIYDKRRIIKGVPNIIGICNTTYIACYLLRAGDGKYAHSAYSIQPTSKERIERWKFQHRLLKQYAEIEDLWYYSKSDFISNFKLVPSGKKGTETEVYIDKEKLFVYKFLKIITENCLYELLAERILIHNLMFGDKTPLKIKGFFLEGDNITFAVCQPFFDAKYTTDDELEKFIKSPSFSHYHKVGNTCVVNSDLVISDLHNKNVLIDEKGQYYVIDCFAKFYRVDDIHNGELKYKPELIISSDFKIRLGSLISEPTKQTFYENLYNQLESIVKDDSFEKNGIRNFILSHIPEDYKNDDIEGIVEVFYQRLRALKCGEKGLGSVSHKFNIGDTIKMPSGVTAKIIGYLDEDKYKIEFDDTVSGRKKIAVYFWKLEEKAVLSDDYHVGDLINYKGFEETIFQIVGFKDNNYVVVELGDRTRTKNEIPFADKDKLQRAVSPLLVKEMELIENFTNLIEDIKAELIQDKTLVYVVKYNNNKEVKSTINDKIQAIMLNNLDKYKYLYKRYVKDSNFGESIGNKVYVELYDQLQQLADNLGNVVYENIPLPFDMQLAGLPDDDVELQFTEMKLLEIEKLHDFGEKIGGSAKDRYSGRHSQSGGGNNTNTKKGFNRLPTMEEVENHKGFLHEKFKPSVADFERLGLNKICARIYFFCYYLDMFDHDDYKILLSVAQCPKIQNTISEYFLDHKRTLNYQLKPFQEGNLYEAIEKQDFYYAALSMNLEKEMKDDFDYRAAVKISQRGNKNWRYYRDSRIFDNDKVSADVKQKVFNIEYENVINNYPVYRVMLSYKGVIFTEQKELTENRRSFRHSQKYVLVEETYSNDWNKLWQNYADYYVKGKQLWEEKYDNEEKWKFTDKDGLVAEKRLNCKDWRNGKNAETTDFINTFGFRAVEFGETMPQKERWEHLNRTYDAFMDLCDILNIKPENISLGGTLGICFGSRGRGGKHAAAAHYEPGKRVINLTRKNGAGCLAHEWFHAFDNQVCDAGFGSENAVSLSDEWRSNKVFYYFNQFLLRTETTNWNMFEFARAAFALNRYERRSKPYWQKKLECAARAFEWYVITKLAEKDRINEYLAQIPKPEPDRLNYYPYPHEADYGSCKQIFDGIFENVVQEKTKYNFFTIKG